MLTFKFSKLVRDRIIDHQIASGAKPSFRYLNPEEHKQELINKIIEEAKEITQASQLEVATEIADVQQALDDLKKLYQLTNNDIATAQAASKDKNGAFMKGVFINFVEINETDPWVDYYRKNADRYPEVR